MVQGYLGKGPRGVGLFFLLASFRAHNFSNSVKTAISRLRKKRFPGLLIKCSISVYKTYSDTTLLVKCSGTNK